MKRREKDAVEVGLDYGDVVLPDEVMDKIMHRHGSRVTQPEAGDKVVVKVAGRSRTARVISRNGMHVVVKYPGGQVAGASVHDIREIVTPPARQQPSSGRR